MEGTFLAKRNKYYIIDEELLRHLTMNAPFKVNLNLGEGLEKSVLLHQKVLKNYKETPCLDSSVQTNDGGHEEIGERLTCEIKGLSKSNKTKCLPFKYNELDKFIKGINL